MAQIALNYSVAQINAAIAKITTLVSVIEGNIVQLYDGTTAIYPRTKAEAVFFYNDISKTLDQQFSQIVAEKGYYVCKSDADDNKQIIFPSTYLINLNSKIRLLVKMDNINKRRNPTFQINATTPKLLYYNGAPASSTNSWAQNEVLDIYYDGSNYIATTYGGVQFKTGEKVGDIGIVNTPGINLKSVMSQKGVTDLVSEYNVSTNNNNTEYTFAQAVALVPASLQKGGLIIKYIDSTTHKYVIKSLISSTWNTTESNWQGVDNDPIEDSKNLIKSGGVYAAFEQIPLIMVDNLTRYNSDGSIYVNKLYIKIINNVIEEIKFDETFIPLAEEFVFALVKENNIYKIRTIKLFRVKKEIILLALDSNRKIFGGLLYTDYINKKINI